MVKVGDYAVFDSTFVCYGNHAIKAKALDDRLGCAILTDILRALHTRRIRPPHNLCFAFTVREEVGLSGAVVAANRVAPKWAVVLETTAIADLQNVPTYRQVATQGEGGALSIMDRSTVYHRGMLRFVQDLAQEKGIPIWVFNY
jgi:endoglucanase